MKLGKFLFSMAKTPIGDYIVGTTFESLSGALPVKRVYENDKVIAFWHPKPFWEQHILIVPKKKIKNVQFSTDIIVGFCGETEKEAC